MFQPVYRSVPDGEGCNPGHVTHKHWVHYSAVRLQHQGKRPVFLAVLQYLAVKTGSWQSKQQVRNSDWSLSDENHSRLSLHSDHKLKQLLLNVCPNACVALYASRKG